MSLTEGKLVNLITNDTNKLEKIMIKNDFPLVAFTRVLLRKCLQDVLTLHKDKSYKLIYIYTRNRLEELVDTVEDISNFEIINATDQIVINYPNQQICNLSLTSIYETLKSCLEVNQQKAVIIFDTLDTLYIRKCLTEFMDMNIYFSEYPQNIRVIYPFTLSITSPPLVSVLDNLSTSIISFSQVSNTFYINLLTKFKSGNVSEYQCECQTKNNKIILISDSSSSIIDKTKETVESIVSSNDIESNTAVIGVGKDMEDEDDDDFEDNDDDIDI